MIPDFLIYITLIFREEVNNYFDILVLNLTRQLKTIRNISFIFVEAY